MKKPIYFATGILCGILLTLGYQHFQVRYSGHIFEQGDFGLEHALNRNAKEVHYAMPLTMTTPKGESYVVRFTPQDDESVKYEWRTVGDDSRRGSGHLFERYRAVAKLGSGTKVVDDGGQLSLRIPGLSLQWSKAASDSGYLYHDPKQVTLAPQDE